MKVSLVQAAVDVSPSTTEASPTTPAVVLIAVLAVAALLTSAKLAGAIKSVEYWPGLAGLAAILVVTVLVSLNPAVFTLNDFRNLPPSSCDLLRPPPIVGAPRSVPDFRPTEPAGQC